MNDQAKFKKMLELLLLLSGNVRYSVTELAKKFDTSERSIYRFLETFRNAGLVLTKTDGYVNIDKNCSELKDISDLLHFTEEEAYILSKAIEAIDDTNVIKRNLTKKLYALYNFDRVVDTVIRKENSANVHALMQAIKQQRQVALVNYQSANSQQITTRLVEPFSFTSNYISVWCYEPATGQNKLFKTARIGSVTLLETGWQNTAKHNAGFMDVFRMSSFKKIPVTLQLSLRAKNLLIEEYPLAEQHLHSHHGTYVFEGFVCNFEGVGRFVLGLCAEVKVINPPELSAFLHQKLAQSAFFSSD